MIIVTGANGAFGRAAAARLIERVPRGQLILTSRTPEKLADFAERGAQVRFGGLRRARDAAQSVRRRHQDAPHQHRARGHARRSAHQRNRCGGGCWG